MKIKILREIIVLAFAMLFPTLLTYIYFVLLNGSPGGAQKAAYGVGKIIQFALPVLVAVICKESWRVRKFSWNGVIEGTAFGVVVYIAMLAMYFFVLSIPAGPLAEGSFAQREIHARISGFGFTNAGLYLLLGLFYSVIHSGLEEYYWRWFVFGRLSKYISWKTACIIAAIGFMSHHVIILGTYFGYGSIHCWLGSLGVAVGGAYWSWLYRRSDSIWGAWISHGIIDAAIFTVGFFLVR
jgi:membrane protease YdiL (CAAX protease family)